MSRLQAAFGALILTQAAHSVEEYAGRLWSSFPPARIVSGLISANLERGFLLANASLVAFGLWCWLWPVRRGAPSAVPLVWAWVILEVLNGIGHLYGRCARRSIRRGWLRPPCCWPWRSTLRVYCCDSRTK